MTSPWAPNPLDAAGRNRLTDVAGAPGTWAHRALDLQHELANDVGFANAPWVGTHNSFNSVAEMGPTLSDTDANQVVPDDPRFRALVWSWAQSEPQAGDCAVLRVDEATPWGRWFATDCTGARPAACRSASGAWSVTAAAVAAPDAGTACTAAGAAHAVPRTGYENQLLRLAMAAAGVDEAWLGYRRSGAEWVALDPR